jgi:hypothetical protein
LAGSIVPVKVVIIAVGPTRFWPTGFPDARGLVLIVVEATSVRPTGLRVLPGTGDVPLLLSRPRWTAGLGDALVRNEAAPALRALDFFTDFRFFRKPQPGFAFWATGGGGHDHLSDESSQYQWMISEDFNRKSSV